MEAAGLAGREVLSLAGVGISSMSESSIIAAEGLLFFFDTFGSVLVCFDPAANEQAVFDLLQDSHLLVTC